MKNHIRGLLHLSFVAIAHSLPIAARGHMPEVVEKDDYWFDMAVSAVLVLLGGVFAGLTIGLMGQDEVYLQVVAESGDTEERKHASIVLDLLSKGKHWVLVTLLLSNVITNETLPIVLDRVLGGGWPAVVSSTAAIVVFGEIIPQSLCVRYGLSLGAWFAPYVKALMYITYPLSHPIALLLDYVLGEDHGTVYKKAGLKSLVTLHHHMGVERLNEDEVTIISAVLDLKEKPIASIMTPINDVFVLASDTILDEDMVEKILLTGFNRIPIHAPGQPRNFIGMLLVRILITYDPEDCLPISAFALATLPETDPDTSCLNILNYFQEGKAHMVVVSTAPGDVAGAIGVVTLEDVIEELIGEEIVDETDVFVDVHRAIRRQHPAPLLKNPNVSRGFVSPSGNLKKLFPMNRASNPITTSNAKITIKHQNEEASRLLAVSDGQQNGGDERMGSRSYGSTNLALSPSPGPAGNAHHRRAHSNGSIKVLNPGDENESKVVSSEADAVSANLRVSPPEEPADEEQLSHSYRTGVFTESVVRVGGFNKVVIAEPSDEDSTSGSS
ncbi:Protein MAM3 [Wickerhamiella sorbophila]|uniref:Protein MAM3 n=1 Tax=Wickerhamiella sorbophila TaxID=45607 RepID=A0A2T0FMR4_9ASCO|nr:Protein MAM3 [Wickerhamiella sorbophila]PRT56288.1 Protein MAM3 [Wickerhamiella sorbophila]